MSRPIRKPSLVLLEQHDPGHIDYTGWFHRDEEDEDYEVIQ
jgi:hypothetical protein